ncbi:MAG: signal peptidase I [Candidatus Dormibacteraeota bacterium]|jgi:signal peptidase|nr:signal peptidase I [Candidatus Dormibacteraeota bacterium]
MNQMLWTADGGAAGSPARTAATRSLAAHTARLVVNLLTLLAVVALLGSILLVALVRQGPDGETSVLGHPLLEVASGSMTPTFDAGDLILDNPISLSAAEHLHRGQVITFRSSEFTQAGAPILITHRIHKVIPSPAPGGVRYQTKGDANNVVDAGLVAPAAIVGIYQGVRVPDGAYVLSALHQPTTFVILAVLLVVFLGAGEFRRRWRLLGPETESPARASGRRP